MESYIISLWIRRGLPADLLFVQSVRACPLFVDGASP